ncbi:hypothetical protein PIROE2DRAFT_68895 [Piromyces sp. E2]|nr:hypothetical protein PIROE2DRAFT_68895 [Piromyces sp. E2]|eukprot:OUM66968.1 hypothetical protein PIROE2DRAFT_68895 [Piromyces sp. E2]
MVIQKKVETLNDLTINNHFSEFYKNNININKKNSELLNDNKMLETTTVNSNEIKSPNSDIYSRKYIQHIEELKKEAFKDLQLQIQRENYSWWKKQYIIENKKKTGEEKPEHLSLLQSELKDVPEEQNINFIEKSSSFTSDCSSSSSSSSLPSSSSFEDYEPIEKTKLKFSTMNIKNTYSLQNNKNYPLTNTKKSLKHSNNNDPYNESPSIYDGKRERKMDINDEYLYNSSKRNKFNNQNDDINSNSSSVSKYYSKNKNYSLKNKTNFKDRIINNIYLKKNDNIKNSYLYPSIHYLHKNSSNSNSNLISNSILCNDNKRTSNDINFYFKYEKELPKFSSSLNLGNSDNEIEHDSINVHDEEIKSDDNHEESSVESNTESESDDDDDAISIQIYSSSYHNDNNNLLFINKNNKKAKKKIDRDGNVTNNSYSSDSLHLDSNGNTPNDSNLLISSISNQTSSNEATSSINVKNKKEISDKELSSLYQLCKTMSVNDYSEVLDYEEKIKPVYDTSYYGVIGDIF